MFKQMQQDMIVLKNKIMVVDHLTPYKVRILAPIAQPFK